MSGWDYNCPKYVDFTISSNDESGGNEEYFDVDHEFNDNVFYENPKELPEKVLDMKLQAPVNLREVLMAGMVSIANSPSKKQHSSSLRRTSARLRRETITPEDGAPAKKQNTGSMSAIAPLLLNRSASRVRAESADRSLPRKAKKVDSRKRHASETRKLPEKKGPKKPILTRVQPFHFATDARIKESEFKAKDCPKRKREEPVQPFTMTLTQVQPFHFATDDRLKTSKGKVEPYVSMAEQVLAFQNQLPDRFKTASSSSSGACHLGYPKLTHPKTPLLRTNLRSRPVYALSQEQKDEEELKEIQNYKFRARPFDPRVLVHTIGIPMVKSKTPTKPISMNLATDKRADVWKKSEEKHEEEVFRFKAKPAPKNVPKGPVRAKPLAAIPSTAPKSPAFALKLRSAAWQKHQEEMAEKQSQEAAVKQLETQRKTRSGSLQPPQSPFHRQPTLPVPFSFDEADKKRFARKEQKIKKLLEKENELHLFHANPMPSPAPSLLPRKPPVVITQPEPFQMLVDKRGQKKAEHWQHQMEEEMKQMKETMTFKARPCTVTSQDPYVPEKLIRPLTETTNITLYTEKRAVERDQYDEKRRQYEADLDAAKRQKEAEKGQEEMREIMKLRKEAVHHPRPIPKFDNPPSIKPSDKPLTEPHSPNFATKLRSQR